jgi:hypothetical protein
MWYSISILQTVSVTIRIWLVIAVQLQHRSAGHPEDLAWLDMIIEVGALICTSFEPFSLSSHFNTEVQAIQST